MKFSSKKSLQFSFLFSGGIHTLAILALSATLYKTTSSSFSGNKPHQTVFFRMGEITIPSATKENSDSSRDAENKKKIVSAMASQPLKSHNKERETKQEKNEAKKNAVPYLSGESGTKNKTEIGRKNADHYVDSIRKRLQQNIFYPFQAKMLGIEGNVIITFQVKENGEVSGFKILSPSRHNVLNDAAFKIVKKSTPFPLPPEGFSHDIQVPLTFRIRN